MNNNFAPFPIHLLLPCFQPTSLQGVASFDYSASLNLVVTGGVDAVVRVWNPCIPTPAVAEFSGHASPVGHVAFDAGTSKQLVSLSVDETIKIWSLKELTCINTLKNLIPHKISASKRCVVSAMVWHAPSQCLITGYQSELAVVQLARDVGSSSTHSSHQHRVTALCYFPHYDMVASGDEKGTVMAWDLATGSRILSFTAAHASAITCLAPDYLGTRLLSGVSGPVCAVR